MGEPFDARCHAAELGTVRHIMMVRCARIVEAGGDDTISQGHVRCLDAVLSLLRGKCSVPHLHRSLDRMLAAGRETITNDELLRLITCGDGSDAITTGDARVLTQCIPDATVNAIVCDPVYWRTEDYRWLGELAARVLVEGGAVLAQVGEPFLYDAWTAFRTGAGGALVHLTPIIECFSFCTSGYRSGETNFSSGYTPWIFATKGPKRCSVMNRFFGRRDKSWHLWGDGLAFAATYIRVLTQPGAVVLDPFTGGGTVPAACIMTGRHFLTCEIDAQTADVALRRLRSVTPPLLEEEPEQLAFA